jgi:peptide/nickel transport system substrate-binding protein
VPANIMVAPGVNGYSAELDKPLKPDLDKAKKLLADAGYPNGFSIEMTYDPSLAVYKSEDIASMIVDMWSKVGVKVTLKPVESAVYTKRVYDHTYTDSILCGRAFMAAGVSMAMGVKDHEENTGAWVNDEYTKMYEQAYAERDAAKSIAIQKQMVIKFFDGASMIPTPVYTTDCWAWSWIRNYYGEISAGFMGHNPMLKLMWIDQAAKKKLGF